MRATVQPAFQARFESYRAQNPHPFESRAARVCVVSRLHVSLRDTADHDAKARAQGV